MPELDLQLVRHALTVARGSGFAEVELCLGGDSFTARLEPGGAAARRSRQEEPAQLEDPILPDTVAVKATLVGYYRPGKVPLELGASVSQGDPIAIIAALGIANDVEAPATGEIVEVLVEPNQAVEFGQVLARIKP